MYEHCTHWVKVFIIIKVLEQEEGGVAENGAFESDGVEGVWVEGI